MSLHDWQKLQFLYGKWKSFITYKLLKVIWQKKYSSLRFSDVFSSNAAFSKRIVAVINQVFSVVIEIILINAGFADWWDVNRRDLFQKQFCSTENLSCKLLGNCSCLVCFSEWSTNFRNSYIQGSSEWLLHLFTNS